MGAPGHGQHQRQREPRGPTPLTYARALTKVLTHELDRSAEVWLGLHGPKVAFVVWRGKKRRTSAERSNQPVLTVFRTPAWDYWRTEAPVLHSGRPDLDDWRRATPEEALAAFEGQVGTVQVDIADPARFR